VITGTFEIYTDAAGEYRWRLKAKNGKIVASGEGYKKMHRAVRGVDAVIRAASHARVAVKGEAS